MITRPPAPYEPSLPWRTSSTLTLGIVASICRGIMFGANTTEVHGLDNFLGLLDSRKDVKSRERGLVTVSNHISVVDDPFIWGVLPLRYSSDQANMRWSLASYDLCFTNKVLSTFFTLGQVLPTHRLKHSPYGGLFQPTILEAVRLLSNPHGSTSVSPNIIPANRPNVALNSPDITDPFSSAQLTYTTNGSDIFPAPAAYPSRKYGWVHIFPEGRVHQHPHHTMRYFKWGVARLILEPDVCPDVVPMWIEGSDMIMHESREFPRFIPRVGKNIGIWFGDNVAGEKEGVFRDLRMRWQRLVEQDRARRGKDRVAKGSVSSRGDDGLSDDLKYGKEAVELRKECTMEVRKEVLRLRRLRGLPNEDPKGGLAETWLEEGGFAEGRMKDGSWVKDT